MRLKIVGILLMVVATYYVLDLFSSNTKNDNSSILTTDPSKESLTCASAAGIKTETELSMPTTKNFIVIVTFIAKRPSNKEIERVVRDCVSVAVKRDGSKSILGSAWFRKHATDDPFDDELLHPRGSRKYLSYEADSKDIAFRDSAF